MVEAETLIWHDHAKLAPGSQDASDGLQVRDQVRLMLDNMTAKNRLKLPVDDPEIARRRHELDLRAAIRWPTVCHGPNSKVLLVEYVEVGDVFSFEHRAIEWTDLKDGT